MGIHYIQIKDNTCRLVIPKPIRQALNIGSGVLLRLTVEGKTKVTVEKVNVKG